MEAFKITATIPTVQYGNIQPEIVVEAETYEQAYTIAMERVQNIWDAYGERPLKAHAIVTESNLVQVVEMTTFTGEKILWNANAHEYTDLNGVHLVSGSEYAKSFEKPFDTVLLSGKVAKKYGVDATRVSETWAGNSKISTTFGTSLHLAMEQWFKFKDTACADKAYNLAKPAFLRAAVESFPLKTANIIPEAIVSWVANKMAGTIDGIEITGDKSCNIIDYKSDSDVEKNLPKHFRQLSYYAKILQLAGWSIGKLVVWNYTDKWTPYESDVLEVELQSVTK